MVIFAFKYSLFIAPHFQDNLHCISQLA